MNLRQTFVERKSIERHAFEHFLRTGERLSSSDAELKFNMWHDPDNGQFTYTYGGTSSSRAGRSDGQTAINSPYPPRPSTRSPSASHTGRPAASKPPVLPAGWRQGGKISLPDVETHAIHAMGQFHENRARGMSVEEAAAWAANSEAESGGDHNSAQRGGGPGRGLYQWGSPIPAYDRRTTFRRIMGVAIENSTREQQYRFRDWELANSHTSTRRGVDAAITAGDKAHVITIRYLAPRDKIRDAQDRANIAEAIVRRARSRP